ncbi:MAG: hypothetical protein ACR2LF_04960 [Jatrophihabitantaceae bacterium]
MTKAGKLYSGAAAVVVLVVAGSLVYVLHGGTTARPAARRPPAASSPLPQPVSTSPVAAPVHVAAAPKPAVPHQLVAPAAPTAFEIKGNAFDVKAQVCGMDYIRPLDPPGDQFHTVCWVQRDFGVAPGSDAKGTSYILGHAWAEAWLVLNPLSVYAMDHVATAPTMQGGIATYPVSGLSGYHVTLRTPTGLLTYRVTDAYTVAKEQAGSVPALMDEHTPDRIVIITCGVHNGADVDVNVVVYATLESSKAA